MPVVARRPELGGTRDEVVGPAEQRRRDVIEVVDDISTRPRQPRVCRHRNAVAVVVGRRHRTVVGHGERGGQRGRCRHRVGVDERIEIPTVVSGFHRDAREDFLLHRDAELPVAGTHARAFQQVRIVGGGRRHQLPEVQVGGRPALPVGGRVQQIAVRDVVAVRIVPGPGRLRRHTTAELPARRIGLDEDARPLRRIHVGAGVDLQRRLPVAEHIHRHSTAIGDVVVSLDDVLLGENDGRRHKA